MTHRNEVPQYHRIVGARPPIRIVGLNLISRKGQLRPITMPHQYDLCHTKTTLAIE